MNVIELESLLAKVQGYDNREVTDDAAAAWAEQLKDVPYAYAAQAVAEHFREEPDKWIGPGHVHRRARAIWERERKQGALETRAAAEERSDDIRQAALERKAADLGTRVATPEEAERYGKGLLHEIMAAVAAVPRDRVGRIPKGAGVAAGERALRAYQAKHGRAPVVDRIRHPCGNPHCQCTHEEPCEAGWIPADPADPTAAVVACPMCKPKAAVIFDNTKPGHRREALALLREVGKDPDGREDKWT